MINLIGKKFGRLTPIKYVGRNKYGQSLWLCKCDCGNEKIIRGDNLRCGDTKSCSCLQKECLKLGSLSNITHGRTHSPTYNIWQSMIQRCINPNNNYFISYGGRDKPIIVCERWSNKNPKGFENFLEDMGEKPKRLSLDRIDNNGSYSPKNCRWATSKEQGRNQRSNNILEYNSKQQCLSSWAEEYNISPKTLWARLYVHQWPIEKALITPVRKCTRN